MSKTQTKAPALTEEQKHSQMVRFIATKREQYTIAILNSLCQNPSVLPENLVQRAVKMADELLAQLYGITDETTKQDGELG